MPMSVLRFVCGIRTFTSSLDLKALTLLNGFGHRSDKSQCSRSKLLNLIHNQTVGRIRPARGLARHPTITLFNDKMITKMTMTMTFFVVHFLKVDHDHDQTLGDFSNIFANDHL